MSTDKERATERVQARITELKARKLRTVGHTKRARIDEHIAALERQLTEGPSAIDGLVAEGDSLDDEDEDDGGGRVRDPCFQTEV